MSERVRCPGCGREATIVYGSSVRCARRGCGHKYTVEVGVLTRKLAAAEARIERAVKATRMLPDCSCSPLHTCGPCLIRFALRAEEVEDG